MAETVIYSDLEMFLTGYIRRELAKLPGQPFPGGFISNDFWTPAPGPAKPSPKFQIIVRDDSGPRTSIVTKAPSVGITVLGSDEVNKIVATNLAHTVLAIMEGCARVEPGNPVAAVLSSNGPYKVPDESGKPSRYMTVELSVTGEPFQ